jgi:hypothetical protein
VGLFALRRLHARGWLVLPGGVLLLVLVLAVPPVGVWLVTTMPRSFGKPEARYLIPFAPAVYVVVALAGAALAGLAGRFRALAGVALAAGLIMVSGWSLAEYWSGRYLADEYKSVALTLRDYARPGEAVVLHTNDTWPAFAYEWNRPFVSTPAVDKQTEADADDFLAPLWASGQGAWLVVNENALEADPQAVMETWLDDRAVTSREWRFGNRRVRFFARTEERAASADSLARPTEALAIRVAIEGPAGRIVGWEQPLRRVRAGDVVHVFGYVDRTAPGSMLNVWLAERPSANGQAPVSPGGSGFARSNVAVLVPADASPGTMHWVAGLGGASQVVGAVEIVAAPDDAEVSAAPEIPVQGSFGEPAHVRLEGYDLHGEPQPGEALNVTLHWRASDPVPTSYKVFVHISAGDGKIVAQRDDFPRQGRRLTTSWRPGEAVADEYVVQLPATLQKGAYRLIVGLYDPATGIRLGPVKDGQGNNQALDQMVIGTLEVR